MKNPLYRGLAATARVGILGGTFDPIHLGHLILAEEARMQLALERIYLVPAGAPPHKQDRAVTPVEQRVQMAELATMESEHLWVSRVDADRPGPHYSTTTVQLLRAELGEQRPLFFLMGLDSLQNLPSWHQPQWLIEHCNLAVLNRPGVEIDWAQLEQALPGIRNRVTLLDMPAIEIASSVLRSRVQRGQSIQFQVPAAIHRYLEKYQLYRDELQQS